ncbi:MAG: peptidoglycan DD-metalloendopeptidase family protein [Halieaceae bacterium]
MRDCRPAWRHLLLTLLLAGITFFAQAQSDEEKAREELKTLQADIERVTREINSARKRQSSLNQQLQETEIELGKLQKQLRQNRAEIDSGRQDLASLKVKKSSLEEARDSQQARIATELQTAWKMGQQGQLKVLLNQEDPHTVARAMAYYRYFFEARHALVTEYRDTLTELAEVESGILTTTAMLQEKQEQLKKQQQSLAKLQKNRELAVASLTASITSKDNALKEKEQERTELERLLNTIEEAVVNLQAPSNYQAFSAARGEMPWPVEGKPSNRFGRPRNEGKMRWQGLNIAAGEGDTVRAIHHGRVVYADWFRGSGLLLIIDHGDGYMSLYAHNQALLRDVGEWVTAGSPISTVGNTGGLARAALYFEIRHNGKPTNPAKWCRG